MLPRWHSHLFEASLLFICLRVACLCPLLPDGCICALIGRKVGREEALSLLIWAENLLSSQPSGCIQATCWEHSVAAPKLHLAGLEFGTVLIHILSNAYFISMYNSDGVALWKHPLAGWYQDIRSSVLAIPMKCKLLPSPLALGREKYFQDS